MRRLIFVAAMLTALACAPLALGATSPTVAPTATTGIGQTSATLHGTVNPEGLATTYQFDYGLTTSLGTDAPLPAGSAGAGTAAVAEKVAISTLTPGTTYYFELVATNSAGTSTSPIETFKTTGTPPPLVTTGAATLAGRYGATFNGSIQPNDGATTYYFEYGLTDGYGEQTMPLTLPAGTTTVVAVSNVMAGLQPGVTFHYRLVAAHGTTSTVYGSDVTFATQPWPRPLTNLHFNVTPHRATQAPYSFTVNGHVALPAGTAASLGCAGVVRLQLMTGSRRLASKTINVNSGCVYTGALRITRLPKNSRHHVVKTLTVEVNYGGDTYIAPSNTGRVQVTVH